MFENCKFCGLDYEKYFKETPKCGNCELENKYQFQYIKFRRLRQKQQRDAIIS